MLIIPGAAALSEFRIEKLLATLQARVPGVQALSAQFVHLADTAAPLSGEQQAVLEKLLEYGPSSALAAVEGQHFFVVPRPGTISPWSSKASDIAHISGLTQIRRLERGVLYRVASAAPLSGEELNAVRAAIHDRMVEAVLDSVDAAECLFEQHEPRPMSRVDVLNGGEHRAGAGSGGRRNRLPGCQLSGAAA